MEDPFDRIFEKLGELQDLSTCLSSELDEIECKAIIQNGNRKGERCKKLCTGKACIKHTIKVKKRGKYYRLVGTNVLLDEEYRMIGYVNNITGDIILEENDNTMLVQQQYDLVFHSIIENIKEHKD